MQHHGAFPHSGKFGNGNGLFAVSEFRINIIRDHKKIVFASDFRDLPGLFFVQHGSGGIAGKVQQDGFCPGRDRFFQIGGIQCKFIFLIGIHHHRHAVGHTDLRDVRHIARLVKNNLISRRSDGADDQIQCFTYAHCDQTFTFRIVFQSVIFRKIIADGFPQRKCPQVRRITGTPLFKREKSIFTDRPRCHKIRFADPEGDHILHGADDLKKITDPALRENGNVVCHKITG